MRLITLVGANEVPPMVPDPTFFGSNVARTMVNGIGFYALVFCLVGLILSAGLWAVGAFSNNYTQSVNGKKGFLICAGAAIAIGAAQKLVGWFAGRGENVDAN